MASPSAGDTFDFQALYGQFTEEARTYLDTLDAALLELERDLAGGLDADLVVSLLGALHTLKGNAGMLGCETIQGFVHHYEGVFKRLLEHPARLSPSLLNVLFEHASLLRNCIEEVAGQPRPDLSGETALLETLATEDDLAGTGGDAMAPLAGNRSGSSSPERAMHFSKSNILRVDFERLDHLLNLAGEMVLQKTKLNRAVQLAEEKAGGEEWFELLAEAAQEVEKTTGELQETIMRVRMLPVRQLFQRFPRMVRDLAHRKGKEIDVTFEGEGTEIDKTVIDALSDPFMHLIRNAVDHGIELPDARRAKGKRPVGSIHLAARQEANHIVISVRDDGAGMDIGRILAKARDRGLIGADQALSEEEITALIFQPGFSTAETVTETSGRGVGLDVVRKVIADFNGLIEARTAAGEGSEFILKMPLTLAIIPALLVEVAGVIYAIPRSAVLESVKCEPGDVHAVDGSEVTSLRGSILTVKHLSRLLGMPDRDEQDGYLVIVGYAEKRVALKVDRLKGQQDVVIKSLGSYVGDTLGIAGATVLGDGRVVLIIDAARLV